MAALEVTQTMKVDSTSNPESMKEARMEMELLARAATPFVAKRRRLTAMLTAHRKARRERYQRDGAQDGLCHEAANSIWHDSLKESGGGLVGRLETTYG